MNTNNQLLDKGICPHCLGNIRLNFTRKWTECNCGDPVNFNGEWPLVFSEFQELQIQNRAFGKIYSEKKPTGIKINARLMNSTGEPIGKFKSCQDVVNGFGEKIGISVGYQLFKDPVKYQVDEFQEAKAGKKQPRDIDIYSLVDSDLDCEFYSRDASLSEITFDPVFTVIGKLILMELVNTNRYRFHYHPGFFSTSCRPRFNHLHAAIRFESCPIPEGFVIKINDSDELLTGDRYLKMNWSSIDEFMIIDIEPGWQLPGTGAK